VKKYSAFNFSLLLVKNFGNNFLLLKNFVFFITVALFANLEAKRAETDSKNLKTGILYKYDFEYS